MQDKMSKEIVSMRWNADLSKVRYLFFQNQLVQIGRINNNLLFIQNDNDVNTRIIINKHELKEFVDELKRYIPGD